MNKEEKVQSIITITITLVLLTLIILGATLNLPALSFTAALIGGGALIAFFIEKEKKAKEEKTKKAQENKRIKEEDDKWLDDLRKKHDGYDIPEDYGGMIGNKYVWHVEHFGEAIRENFSELPLKKYRVPNHLLVALTNECANSRKPSNEILRAIVADMGHHIGINVAHLVVLTEKAKNNKAGFIEKNFSDLNFITIGYDESFTAENYIAIIAHELSHAYQFNRDNFAYHDPSKVELFTDALTIYLGFGHYTFSGKSAIGLWEYTLGYMDLEEIPFFMQDVLDIVDFKKNKEMEKRKQNLLQLKNDYFSFANDYSCIRKAIGDLRFAKNIKNEELFEISKIASKYTDEYYNYVKKLVKNIGQKEDAEIDKTSEIIRSIVNSVSADCKFILNLAEKQFDHI